MVSSRKGTCWFLEHKTQSKTRILHALCVIAACQVSLRFFHLLRNETTAEAVPPWECEQGKRWGAQFRGSAALCWCEVECQDLRASDTKLKSTNAGLSEQHSSNVYKRDYQHLVKDQSTVKFLLVRNQVLENEI